MSETGYSGAEGILWSSFTEIGRGFQGLAILGQRGFQGLVILGQRVFNGLVRKSTYNNQSRGNSWFLDSFGDSRHLLERRKNIMSKHE